tara:strand:+ start:182 stop:1081 length:900 start_codon:yes stop_codon:yes gene_type:complete
MMGIFDMFKADNTAKNRRAESKRKAKFKKQTKKKDTKPFTKQTKEEDTKPFKKVAKKTPPNFKAQSAKPVGKGFNIRKSEQEAKALGKKADQVKAASKKVVASKPATPMTPPPKVKSNQTPSGFEQYKSMAAAKKAGSLYYEKDGKKMAAVSKEDLAPGQSLRDYMNEKTNKKRKGKFISPSKDEMSMDMPKMKGGGAMKTKMSTKGGMKGGGMTTKGYAKGGMKDLSGDGKITQKDVLMGRGVNLKAGGGMMTTKGGMKGGGMTTKGNTKGGAKKRTSKAKVRGAGIARKGVRPAKMR